MKIIINEDKVNILLEHDEEITFHSFFTNLKKFLKGLLQDPVNSIPSDELREYFGCKSRGEIIKKLIDNDIIRVEHKLKEIPKGVVEDDKSQVSFSVKYSIPKQNFKEKIHKLYDNTINESKSVFANEDELKQQILNSNDGDVYRKRGGLRESKKYQLERERQFKYDEMTRNVIRELFPQLENKFDEVACDENGTPILTQKGDTQTYLQYLQRDIKHKFILDNADVRFEPIVAKIAYKELGFGQDPDTQKINNLRRILKIITSSHQSEYDDNLNGMGYDSLERRFISTINKMSAQLRRELNSTEFKGECKYTIYPINSFEDAKNFYKYTPNDSKWCLTHMSNMFNAYTEDGINKLYFAAVDGFENIKEVKKEGAPLDEYGLSLISVIVDPEGNLAYCTTRWNHLNGGTDSSMDEIQLSQIINRNFYKVFPPYSFEETLKRSEELIQNIEDYIDNKYDKDIYDGVENDLIELCTPKGDLEDYATTIEPEDGENMVYNDETEEWEEDEDYEYETEITDESISEYIRSSTYWIIDLSYYDSDYDEGTRFVIYNSDLDAIEIKEIFSSVKYVTSENLTMFSVKRLNGDYETFTLSDARTKKKEDSQLEIDFPNFPREKDLLNNYKTIDVLDNGDFTIEAIKTDEGWKKTIKDTKTNKLICGLFDDIITNNDFLRLGYVEKEGKKRDFMYDGNKFNFTSMWYDEKIKLYNINVYVSDGISYFVNLNNKLIAKTTEKVNKPNSYDGFSHVNDFRYNGELIKGNWNLFTITSHDYRLKQVWMRAEDGLTFIKNGDIWDNGKVVKARLK